ncbi:MAG: PAS domain S-box protein [Oscillochloris sp.]|nr:PAS domain S-box protein [Oscillochloris sp.]
MPLGLMLSTADSDDHAIFYANRAITAMTGYHNAEIVGRNCRFFQGPDTDPAAVAAIRAALQAHRSLALELRNYRRDGTLFWNALTLNPVHDSDGTLFGYVGIQHDITARRLAVANVEQQMCYAEALAECSRILLDSAQSDDAFAAILARALAKIRVAIGGDRIAVYHYPTWEHNQAPLPSEIQLLAADQDQRYAPILQPSPEAYRDFPPEIMASLLAGNIYNKRLYTPEHPRYQAYLDASGIRAVCLYPIFVEEKYWGHITVSRFAHEAPWDDDAIRVLRTAGEMIVTFTRGWQSARQLREREELLRSISDTMPGGYLYQTIQRRDNMAERIIYISGSIQNLLGLSPAQIDHDPVVIDRIIHPDDLALLRARDRDSLRTISTFEVELRVYSLAGRLIWLYHRAVPSLHADGVHVIWNGFALDITARKEMELALAASEARLRAIRNALPDITVVLANDGTFLEVNIPPGTASILTPDVVGRRAEQFMPAAELAAFQRMLIGARRFGLQVVEHNVQERWYETRITPIDDELQLMVVRDITERREAAVALLNAKEAAEAAARAKTTFLASMSHEIRTPLNVVIGMASLLLQSNLSDDQRTLATPIVSAGEALLAVINNILDLSRSEAGKLELELQPFDLHACLRDSVALVAHDAQRKGLQIDFRIAPEVPQLVMGDMLRLRQVLLNLLSNAVKFTARGSVSLVASARPRDDAAYQVTLTVSDTGIGISREERDRIFDPFEQADSSTTRRYGGSGLGLAISRQLIRLMHGDLSVESQLDHGSHFTVALPLHLVVTTTAKIPPPPAEEHVDRPLKILLVEDNPLNQEVAQRLLRRLGHEVHILANGRAAVAAVTATTYDAVLMDVQMPEMDGVTATRRIRDYGDSIVQPRIIALTASALAGDRERFLQAGMDDYLSKPILVPELVRALSGLPHAVPLTLQEPQPLIDWAVWDHLVASFESPDPELLVLQMLSNEIPLQLAELKAAVAAQNMAAMRYITHRMRGGCLQLGAVALAGLCLALEQSEPMPEALADLEQCYAHTLAVLHRRRSERMDH